jgi:hypothetical protein
MTDDSREPPASKLPLGGILVLALVGGVVLLFTAGDTSWNPFAGPSANAQAMELSGQWLGMRLAASNTASAQSLGVVPMAEGVVVAELVMPEAARAQQAGLLPGDVLVGLDGSAVANLTDLYTLTTTLDVNRPVPISIVRQGQPLSLLLPPPPGMYGPAVGASPGMASPFVTGPVPALPGPAFGATAAPAPPVGGVAAPGAMFYCPNDRLYWTQAQVEPAFTCPRCGGQLAR